jgi:hypothetical protein
MKWHQDERPMEIDQDHMFVDRNLGRKKGLDDLKQDFGVSSGPVPEKSPTTEKTLTIFGILQLAAVCALVVCALDLVAGGGWKALTPALIRDAVVILVAAALLVSIHFLQKSRQNKGR